MIIDNIADGNTGALPQALRAAQAAIHLPEVREMLRKLAKYKLGVFMPHMHDEQSGDFQPLPDDVTQVESGLEVSFRPATEIDNKLGRYLPVGWLWRAGATRAVNACEIASREQPVGETPCVKHKMLTGNR